MTIKQQGGIFGRNPKLNDVEANTVNVSNGITVGDGHTIGDDQFDNLYIESSSNEDIFLDSGRHIVFESSGSESMRIQSDDLDMTAGGGNIILGSGSGIDFSATSGSGTSELFSDYEEGGWSPVVADAQTGGNTGTIGAIEASYTKVGRLVTIYVAMININTSGMTAGNVLYIRGLPYASSSTNGVGDAIGVCRVDGIDFTGFITSEMANGNAYFSFIDNVDSAGDTQITVSDVQSSSSDIVVAMTYGT